MVLSLMHVRYRKCKPVHAGLKTEWKIGLMFNSEIFDSTKTGKKGKRQRDEYIDRMQITEQALKGLFLFTKNDQRSPPLNVYPLAPNKCIYSLSLLSLSSKPRLFLFRQGVLIKKPFQATLMRYQIPGYYEAVKYL